MNADPSCGHLKTRVRVDGRVTCLWCGDHWDPANPADRRNVYTENREFDRDEHDVNALETELLTTVAEALSRAFGPDPKFVAFIWEKGARRVNLKRTATAESEWFSLSNEESGG